MATKTRKPVIKERKNTSGCAFCKAKMVPDYKDYENLAKFMSDRAKVAGRMRSGLCAKHQRRLAQAVKRARHLGLLPFTGRA